MCEACRGFRGHVKNRKNTIRRNSTADGGLELPVSPVFACEVGVGRHSAGWHIARLPVLVMCEIEQGTIDRTCSRDTFDELNAGEACGVTHSNISGRGFDSRAVQFFF